MDWIKCTDRMPPDGEPILITIESWMDKHRYVWETQARWHNGFYEVWEDDGLACGWASGRFAGSKVTHWMPYPEPAEDLGSVNMCNYHDGDEAIFWEDENNNAFVDSYGEMLLTVSGHEIQFRVTHCPMCGEKLK